MDKVAANRMVPLLTALFLAGQLFKLAFYFCYKNDTVREIYYII
jgi:hypothetical protein